MKPSQSHIHDIRGLRYHVRTWGDSRARPLFHGLDADLGWSSVAGSLSVVVVPGNHMSMLQPPHVRRLASALY